MDWDFISSDLLKFGYGEKFVRMIKIAYSDIQSKIWINGLTIYLTIYLTIWLSDHFSFMQGVRQGCPLSMVLYITVAYVFASFTDADKRIKGMQIEDHKIKLVSFANEITFLLGDIACVNRIQVILKLFQKASN